MGSLVRAPPCPLVFSSRYNVPTYTGNQGSNSVTGPTGSNTSTCIFVVNTGNQTNVKGSNNGWYNTTAYGALAHAPVTFPNTSMCAPNNPGIKANAAYLSKYGCYVNATNNNQPTYPYGINPVPPGTKIQGVVYYTSSNTHTWRAC